MGTRSAWRRSSTRASWRCRGWAGSTEQSQGRVFITLLDNNDVNKFSSQVLWLCHWEQPGTVRAVRRPQEDVPSDRVHSAAGRHHLTWMRFWWKTLWDPTHDSQYWNNSLCHCEFQRLPDDWLPSVPLPTMWSISRWCSSRSPAPRRTFSSLMLRQVMMLMLRRLHLNSFQQICYPCTNAVCRFKKKGKHKM